MDRVGFVERLPGLELGLSYFLDPRAEARFLNQDFLMMDLKNETINHAKVFFVDRGSALGGRAPILTTLPNVLHGRGNNGETLYRIKILFSGSSPARFNFTPPPMEVGGMSYPVRTFTYRFLDASNGYKVCM